MEDGWVEGRLEEQEGVREKNYESFVIEKPLQKV